MNLLTCDRSASRAETNLHSPIRLVSTGSTEARSRRASSWLIFFGIAAGFLGGFGLSTYWRPPSLPPEPKIQIADFRVELPEGDTAVVITSREGSGRELGRIQISRQGDLIRGVPESTRQIAPRHALSAEDATFFRRELNGVLAAGDATWAKANK